MMNFSNIFGYILGSRVPAGFKFGFGFIGFWFFHVFSGSGLSGLISKVRVFGFLGSRVGTIRDTAMFSDSLKSLKKILFLSLRLYFSLDF